MFNLSKRKNLIILLASLVVIIAAVAAFFIWQNSRERLVRLAPDDAIVYMQFNRDDVSTSWSEVIVPAFPALTAGLAWLPDWEQVLNSAGKRFAFIVLPEAAGVGEAEEGLSSALVIEAASQELNTSLIQPGNYKVINDRIIVLAETELGIQKVSQVFEKTRQSLHKVVSESFSNDEVSIYLSGQATRYIPAANGVPAKLVQALNSAGSITINLNRDRNLWRVSVPSGLSSWDPSVQLNTNFVLAESLPSDTLVYTAGIDLDSILAAWNQLDPNLGELFTQIFTNFESLYQVKAAEALEPLLQSTVELVITDGGPSAQTGLGFLATFDGLPAEFSQDKLESFLKAVLVTQDPVKKERILPDGTTVTELIADPGAVSFASRAVGSTEVRFLSVTNGGTPFAYSRRSGTLWLASSPDLLVRTLASLPDSLRLPSLPLGCRGRPLVVIGDLGAGVSRHLSLSYLPSGILTLWTDASGGLAGCLVSS
ncbi:hypothetical protein CL634_02455 [bacterium]|nr:hypothetical protein [bacterium]|tara:strand:- start:128 stop:1576 length:1449 start_codon:yes stop_codon:yes gene_type:complete